MSDARLWFSTAPEASPLANLRTFSIRQVRIVKRLELETRGQHRRHELIRAVDVLKQVGERHGRAHQAAAARIVEDRVQDLAVSDGQAMTAHHAVRADQLKHQVRLRTAVILQIYAQARHRTQVLQAARNWLCQDGAAELGRFEVIKVGELERHERALRSVERADVQRLLAGDQRQLSADPAQTAHRGREVAQLGRLDRHVHQEVKKGKALSLR
eukprot:scaffold2790_cov239-Pinguiococcus_pyrenoidosus.AAC.6